MCLTFIKFALNETGCLDGALIATIRRRLLIVNPICWSNRFVVTHTHHWQPLLIRFKANFNQFTIVACAVGATSNMMWRLRANNLWNVDDFCVDFELPACNACSRNWFFAFECWTKSFGAIQFDGFASRKFNFTIARLGVQKFIGTGVKQQRLWFAQILFHIDDTIWKSKRAIFMIKIKWISTFSHLIVTLTTKWVFTRIGCKWMRFRYGLNHRHGEQTQANSPDCIKRRHSCETVRCV